MSDTNVIRLPFTDLNSDIGDVLMAIFETMDKTGKAGQEIVWDYVGLDCPHPFFISAMAVYRDSVGNIVRDINQSEVLLARLNALSYYNVPEFVGEFSPETALDISRAGYVAPICKFSRLYKRIDEVQTQLLSIITKRISSKVDGWRPHMAVSYLLGELICNIQEHSHATHG